MAVPVPFAGEYPGEGAGGRVCRFLLRTHPTDGRSLASCLCIKESIDGSNGLSWHPYAFVWRSSEGVSGGTFALGRPVFAAMRLRYGGWDCCEPKRKKLRGKHEGTRIGPLTGHMGRGRTSMTNTRQAKARRRFRNRRFRDVTRAAGRGPEESKRRVPGGNRQSGGAKTKPRKPNDFNGFRGSNPGGGYEIRTREAVTPTRFPSVRHRPLGESSIALFAAAFGLNRQLKQNTTDSRTSKTVACCACVALGGSRVRDPSGAPMPEFSSCSSRHPRSAR